MADPIFVTFEGKIHAAQQARAQSFYETLAPLVVKQPGFISETGFVSVDQEGGQVLYVSFESEETLHAWRRERVHLGIQKAGREGVFVDYRIRVGREVGDGLGIGEAMDESRGRKRQSYLLVWQYSGSWDGGSEASVSASVEQRSLEGEVWRDLVDAATYHNETHVLRITAWSNLDAARAVQASVRRVDGDDLLLIRVERDYGQFQREEAPEDADKCQAAAVEAGQDALTV